MQERMDTEVVMTLLRPMPVHQRVATLRKLHNMSQQAMADELKVDRGSVSSWEADPSQERAHAPGEEARAGMASLFGIPAYVFTADYGMQNFQQMGFKVDRVPRGRPPVKERPPEQLPALVSEDEQELAEIAEKLKDRTVDDREIHPKAPPKPEPEPEPESPAPDDRDGRMAAAGIRVIRGEPAPQTQTTSTDDQGYTPPPPGVRRI